MTFERWKIMSSEFQNYMKEYKGLESKIEEKKEILKLLKAKISEVKRSINEDEKQLATFGQDKFICVNLGDILREVASLKNIPFCNLKVTGNFSSDNGEGYRTRFNYNLSEDDFLKIEDGSLNVLITEKFDNFDASFSFKCLLNDVQDDDRILFEHMRLKRYESKSDYYANDKSYSTLELNEEGAEFIRCHFSLNEIMKFYNNDDVFSKAILNVVERKKEKQKKLLINA